MLSNSTIFYTDNQKFPWLETLRAKLESSVAYIASNDYISENRVF
jgi:hypothetical protein